MLKQGESLPEIYTDPAFGQSNHWELSTSQLSSRFISGWGYGEGGVLFFSSRIISLISLKTLTFFFLSFTVVPDGYGLAYAIGDDYIRWTITTLEKDAAELKRHLTEAANEVKKMLEASKKSSDSHHPHHQGKL